jgi:hypothetical protein
MGGKRNPTVPHAAASSSQEIPLWEKLHWQQYEEIRSFSVFGAGQPEAIPVL